MGRKKKDTGATPTPENNQTAAPESPYVEGAEEHADEEVVVLMTKDTMAKDLVGALLDELRQFKDYQALPELRQQMIIDRLVKRVKTNVDMAVTMIAANGRITIPGKLAQVTMKNGIKAVFEIASDAPYRHDFMDCIGDTCLIVVADSDRFKGGTEEIRAQPDQKGFMFDSARREPEETPLKDVTGTAEATPAARHGDQEHPEDGIIVGECLAIGHSPEPAKDDNESDPVKVFLGDEVEETKDPDNSEFEAQ